MNTTTASIVKSYASQLTLSNGAVSIIMTANPTGNCQLWCIAYFENIASAYCKKETAKLMYETAYEASGKKNLLLIDIKETIKDKVEAMIRPDCIIGKFPYPSTSGSRMIIYLIKTLPNECPIID